MPYTLWSRDRLVGESDLDYLANTPEHKTGDFEPTEFGLSIMPTLTGVRRTSLEYCRVERERHEADPIAGLTDPEARNTTEYADVAEAIAAYDALELELRAPDGARLLTESIHVTDTQEVIEFGERRAAERAMRGEQEHAELDIDEYDDLLFPDGDDELMESIEHDIALLDEMFEKNAAEARAEGFDVPTGREQRPFPRYQIQVYIAQARSSG